MLLLERYASLRLAMVPIFAFNFYATIKGLRHAGELRTTECNSSVGCIHTDPGALIRATRTPLSRIGRLAILFTNTKSFRDNTSDHKKGKIKKHVKKINANEKYWLRKVFHFFSKFSSLHHILCRHLLSVRHLQAPGYTETRSIKLNNKVIE